MGWDLARVSSWYHDEFTESIFGPSTVILIYRQYEDRAPAGNDVCSQSLFYTDVESGVIIPLTISTCTLRFVLQEDYTDDEIVRKQYFVLATSGRRKNAGPENTGTEALGKWSWKTRKILFLA